MMVREDSSAYDPSEVTKTKRNKGNLGQIIEEKFFHYECNSNSRADLVKGETVEMPLKKVTL